MQRNDSYIYSAWAGRATFLPLAQSVLAPVGWRFFCFFPPSPLPPSSFLCCTWCSPSRKEPVSGRPPWLSPNTLLQVTAIAKAATGVSDQCCATDVVCDVISVSVMQLPLPKSSFYGLCVIWSWCGTWNLPQPVSIGKTHTQKQKTQRNSKQNKRVKPYTFFESHSQGHVHNLKKPTVVASLMLVACWRDNPAMMFCLCWPTMTLHQVQGHWHGHEHRYHAYHHAKFECHSFNNVRYIAVI